MSSRFRGLVGFSGRPNAIPGINPIEQGNTWRARTRVRRVASEEFMPRAAGRLRISAVFVTLFGCEPCNGAVAQQPRVFRRDSGNRLARNSSKDFSFSSLQYCPARTSHRYRPSSTNRVSRSASDLRSQARITSILVSTNRARLRLSLRSMGGILVCKLVKPTKVFCSRAPHQRRFGQILSPQTEPDVGTTGAGVLGKADATVGQKLGGFDPSDRVLDQSPEFFALVVVDRGPEVLNLDQPLADENHLSHVGNTCDPGIANQLRVKSQQPSWFLRISAGRGLPFQQAASAVQIADGIHIGYEVVLATQGLGEFDLQVATRLADANPIVLRKAIKQLPPRLQHAVPAIALGVVKAALPVRCPFPVEHRSSIL